jgi:lipoate synthase
MKWSYLVLTNITQDDLNVQGAEEWELINIIYTEGVLTYYFKKES